MRMKSMESFPKKWFLSFLVALLIILIFSIAPGNLSASNNSQISGPFVKVIAPSGVLNTNNAGVSLWHDYGSFALYRVTQSTLEALPADVQARLVIDSNMDQLLFEEATINTKLAVQSAEESITATEGGETLQLIQFVGPIKDEWLTEVESTGAKLVQYVASNGYLAAFS